MKVGVILIAKMMTWLISWLVSLFKIFSKLAADIFDAALVIAQQPLQGLEFISIGWALTRDLANLFFIFILLVIAIATILRIEPYGAKALLVRLIVVALLINFSLVISAAIIDATNILGNMFISQIQPVGEKIMRITNISSIDVNKLPVASSGASIGTPYWDNVSKLGGPINPELSVLHPDSLYKTISDPDKAFTNSLLNLSSTILIVVFLYLLTFAFLAFSALYIIRTVMLMFLLVLAPVGYLFTILPATRGVATMWWRSLGSYALFFPATAFFLYLSIIHGYQGIEAFTQAGLKDPALSGNFAHNLAFIFNYLVIIVMLYASLIVGRMMGVAGAAYAVSLAPRIARRLQGYAGRGGRYVGVRGAQAVAPAAAQAAQRLAAIPLAGRVLAKPFAYVTRVGEQERTRRERAYQETANLSRDAIRAQHAATVNPNERRLIRAAALTAGKGDIFTTDELADNFQEFTRQNNRQGMRNVLGTDPRALAAAMGVNLATATPTDITNAITTAMTTHNITLNTKDIEDFSPGVANNTSVARAIAERGSPAALTAVAARGGALFTNVRQSFEDIEGASTYTGTRLERLAHELEALGNAAAAHHIANTPGGAVFRL